MTVALTLISSLLSVTVGIWFGTLRLSGRLFLRWLATVYVEIHRNIPALVLIIFWAFAVPNLFAAELRQGLFFDNTIIYWAQAITGLSLPYYAFAALLGLSLNTSAYIAEIFRAGVGTIAQEHLNAAYTLGAPPSRTFWHIVLPEGLRVSFPAISTRLIHNMKNTALASFVSVPEFFQATQTAITRTFLAFEFLLVAAVIYLVLAFLFAQLLQWVEKMLIPFSKI